MKNIFQTFKVVTKTIKIHKNKFRVILINKRINSVRGLLGSINGNESKAILARKLNTIELLLKKGTPSALKNYIDKLNFEGVKEIEIDNYSEVKKAFDDLINDLKKYCDSEENENNININSSNITFGCNSSNIINNGNNEKNKLEESGYNLLSS